MEPMEPMVEIGARIARWRLEQGVKQDELARRARINQSYLSKIERGKSEPALTIGCRLAHALGRTTDELCTGQPPADPAITAVPT